MTRGLALQICRIYVAVSLAGDKSQGWTAERLDHPAKEQKLSSGDLMLHVGIREGAKQYNRIVGRWPCGSVKEGLERCESRKEMVNSLQQHLWPGNVREGPACACGELPAFYFSVMVEKCLIPLFLFLLSKKYYLLTWSTFNPLSL